MALMVGSLYDALKAAGVDDDKAKRAAEEVAAYDNQLADLKGTAKLHSWMLGFNLAMSIAILFKVFS